MKKFSCVVSLLLVGVLMLPFAALAVPVDLELVLAVDTSGSISSSEFNLQRSGYEAAFRDGDVINAITNTAGGAYGAIATTLVYWSSSNQQVQSVGWTYINSSTSSNAFADLVAAASRPYSGTTGIGEAIQFSSGLFAGNGFEGSNNVIDISGDGTDNSGVVSPQDARDSALAGDVDIINGLVIGGGSSLLNYYTSNVIGGTGSFAIAAADFDAFAAAVRTKILREVSGGDPPPASVPEPGAIALVGLGLFGLACIERKRIFKK